MGEVHPNARINGELLVPEHLFALVVGECLFELGRHGTECPCIRFSHRHRIFLLAQRNKQSVAGGALHECAEGGFPMESHDKVAFPVAGYGTVGDFLRPLLNGEHVGDFTSISLNFAVFFLAAVFVLLPQGLDEGASQLTSGEHIDIAIDRLVGNAHRHIKRILFFESFLNLFGRPLARETGENVSAQTFFFDQTVFAEVAGRGANSCLSAGREGSVLAPIPPAAVPLNLSRDGGRVTVQGASHLGL